MRTTNSSDAEGWEVGLTIVWKSLREVQSISEALYVSNQDTQSYDLKVIS